VAGAPGNVALSAKATGLPKSSVANVLLVIALDKSRLHRRVGQVTRRQLETILRGIDIVLGR
jgi:mRNA interferase MazF